MITCLPDFQSNYFLFSPVMFFLVEKRKTLRMTIKLDFQNLFSRPGSDPFPDPDNARLGMGCWWSLCEVALPPLPHVHPSACPGDMSPLKATPQRAPWGGDGLPAWGREALPCHYSP